jgi:hypothetical protein
VHGLVFAAVDLNHRMGQQKIQSDRQASQAGLSEGLTICCAKNRREQFQKRN